MPHARKQEQQGRLIELHHAGLLRFENPMGVGHIHHCIEFRQNAPLLRAIRRADVSRMQEFDRTYTSPDAIHEAYSALRDSAPALWCSGKIPIPPHGHRQVDSGNRFARSFYQLTVVANMSTCKYDMQTCTCRKVCSKNANKAKFFLFLVGWIGGKSGSNRLRTPMCKVVSPMKEM